MKYFSLSRFFSVVFVLLSTGLVAQLTITMDHADGNYSVGETVHFQIHSTVSATATYTINRGKYTDALATGSVQLNAGATTDVTIVGAEPENLHFSISTGWTGAVATAMVGVDQMVLFEPEPTDFDAFWDGVKGQLAGVPMNAQVIPYNSTTYSTSYTVSLGNIDGRKVYGMLTVPKGAGPFPVVLKMPPFGSFPIPPEVQFAERTNAITLAITIHNAPVTQTDPNAYSPDDATNKDLIYHKHSVTAGIRALDYLTSRPDFNGTDVAITGVSQGGGLGMLVAGLDNRVNLLLIGTPTMGSHAGMAHNHPSGFPFYLNIPLQVGNQQDIDAVLQATKYYEAASAAKRFHGKVFLLTSYNDQVTIPETQFIASNYFSGKKVILHNLPGGHDNRPTQYLFGRFDYLRRYFPASNNPPFPWAGTEKGYMADAGADKTASVGIPVSLTGTIEKNTTTNPNIPVTWRKVSGPGNVTFTSPNAYSTQANFSQNGTYVLEFRGKDTELLASNKLFYTISDRVVVTVGGGSGNPAPTVVLSTPSNNVTGPFQVVASFSESVSGLSLSDFTITNGIASNLSNNGSSSYTFTVTPSNIGTVTISLPSGKVVDATNQGNSASNTLTVQYSVVQNQDIDLALNLVADNTTVPLYAPVNFTLTLSNDGASTAHNIKVDFKLPQGFGLTSSFASQGQYNSWTGVWTLGQLAVGASATVQVAANLNTANPPAYFAQVTAAQENDVDSSPNNNAGPTPVEDDEAAVTVSAGGSGNQAPTVVLSTPSNTVTGAFQVTASFSASVTGLSLSDFNIANGTASNLSSNGTTSYTFTVTPSNTGNVTISLPANKVTASTGGLGNIASNTLSVQYENTPTGEYCTASGTPWNEWIKRVKVGSIDNYSNKEGYADFTNLSTDLAKGVNQDITISYGHGYWIYDQNYSVWIDYNHDKDFDDPGELVLTITVPAGPNGSNPADVVGHFLVSNDATVGQTRMRVALNRNGAPTPCGNGGLGEYEDYSVNISDGGGTNTGTYCSSESTPWNDWIARVQINSINNASNKDGYGDFTNLVTDVSKGQNTNLTITLGHGYFIYNEYYRVWVDLNQDGDFDDANEMVVSQMVAASANGSNPAPLVTSINLPDYTLLGQTRMRVSMRRDGYGTPCNQGGFGEVEDYTINVIDGGMTGPVDYCSSNATPWNDWIKRVQIGSIDKSSSKEGYADFTELSTNLMKGVPTQITISLGHGYWIYDERYNVWIDFNHDGDFTDAGELVMSQLVSSSGNNTNPAPVVGSILIPSSALAGVTRMRVAMRRGNNQYAPCNTVGFGETEDYTINIQTAISTLVYTNLLDFNATEYMAGVKTDWVVDNAAATDFFVLQRLNASEFDAIAQFDYEVGLNQFDYWDANALEGMNYYRLELHELNGETHYSEIKAVQIMPEAQLDDKVILFPTLSNGYFKVNMSDYQGLAAKIDLINVSGQIVKSWQYDQLNQNLMSFDISEKKKGIYFVNIQVDGKRALVEKVILKE